MEKKLFLALLFGTFLVASMFVIALAHFSPAMAATITVTNTNDSGAGSLREAITNAAPGDTINLSVTGTITLTTGELLINKDLTISGPGADSLAISGNNASRVFKITTGTVNISGMTIRNGSGSGAGGGGGVNNSGTLTLSGVTISNNSEGAGFGGGAIFDSGDLTLINATITGNSSPAGGGGIYTRGVLTLTNVTINGNTSATGGGLRFDAGTATLTNVTISGNTTANEGGGGGICNGGVGGTATLRNTIVANDPSAGNCSGPIISSGHNLSSDNTCGFHGTGDLNNTDPLLGPLQDNGGPTFTQALLPGSPAIDAADPTDFPTTDQRGVPRPQGSGPDIGAYEWTPVNPYEGTIGTEITITGSGFGANKGKVVVGGASLKILDWTEDSIQCALSKALQPDTYNVIIRPQAKGATPITLPNGFAVKAPKIDSVDLTSGPVGDEIIIEGKFFGTKKPKVSLGKKSCKILNWEMNSTTGESQIQFAVPKGLSIGTNELKVTTTGVGSDTVSFMWSKEL